MTFHKYHGTGNDFILIDNRDGSVVLTKSQVSFLCHRRFGIGADGLMLLELAPGYDFRMVYYNSDGGESTMCGNGGRCITAFAKSLGIVNDVANFLAVDGPHTARTSQDGIISLHMKDVQDINIYDDHTILNTGSPHYIKWEKDVKEVDVFAAGRAIRKQEMFQPDGINVNFVQLIGGGLHVRTYERGVEDETLSCGTGVTAAAIAATCSGIGSFSTRVDTPGGHLQVSFTKPTPVSATNVILTGPAAFVYSGSISVF